MSKRHIIIACLFGTGLLVFLLWRSPPDELRELLGDTQQIPQYPTSYIEGARTRQYDELGQLSYTLDAKLIRYYDRANTNQPEAIIEEPELTLFDGVSKGDTTVNEKAITRVSADMAEGSQKQDQLELLGNVLIQQTQVDGSVSTLKTDALLVQPNRRYAETDKPVIITDQNGNTTATGLRVYFDEKRIELLSNVKGTYVIR